MAGILSRIERRSNKSSAADEVVLRSRSRTQSSSTNSASDTKLVQSDSSLGSAEDLLAELNAEGKSLRQHAKAPSTSAGAPVSASSKASDNGNAQSQALSKPATKIKVVHSEAISTQSRKTTNILDESLPWWLTEPSPCSPQVDALVPVARLVLNDLIGENISSVELTDAINKAVSIAAEQLSSEIRFSGKDLQEASQELISLLLGKGPLQALYDDAAVTDIYLDGYNNIKCVRRGQALETPFRFRSSAEYEAYYTAMLQSVDRVLNLSSPIVDCVLNDTARSRVNGIHSSLRDGAESAFVIRIPRLQQISFYDLLRTKTLPATLAAWLAELVSCGEANILVMGPTGSGKTTLTTALLSAVASDERICTIEDVPEIFVPTIHLEKLVSRPENSQGEGSVGMDQLLRASLRRAPHRIVVGEIRDREGPLFLKALETGHRGSVATIHAESPRDGLWRLLDVVAAHEKSPQESIQRRIARSVQVLIAMKRVDGRPCLTDVSEVKAPINGEFVVKQLVRFEGEVGSKRQWRILSNHSEWIDRLRARGMELQAGPGLLPPERSQESRGETDR